MSFKPRIISGTCVCGHSWEEHHLGVIVNPDILEEIKQNYPEHPWYIPMECEYYGFNETGGLDDEGRKHCFGYRDKDA